MSEERYEIFGADDSIYKLIKDNEELPNLLNIELACVRMNKFVEQIADLEAKLAEKERQLKLAEELLIKQEREYDEQLKKQATIHYKHLEEKEKEIERLKTNYVGGMQNANEATRIFKEEYYKANQSKTEFAIEKLQRVKEELNNSARQYVVRLTDSIPVYSSYVTLTQLNETIDEIIKKIGGKSEKN